MDEGDGQVRDFSAQGSEDSSLISSIVWMGSGK